MSLDEMATFAHVVKTGSFSAAARALGSRKSSVSAQIQRLERRLGIRLLNRTTRRVDVTEAGAAFYSHCARIVAEAEAATEIAASFHNRPLGQLSVSAPDTFGWMHIAPLLPDFLRTYPEVCVRLSLSERHVDLLAEHLDLAIRIGRVSGTSLTVKRIGTASMVICASPEYLASRPPIRSADDLARHDTLVFTPLGWGNEWRLRDGTQDIRIPLIPRLQSDSGDVLRAAAVRGGGVALLPQWMVAADLTQGRLKRLLRGTEPPGVDISVVLPPGRERAAKVRVFVDFLARRLGRKPQWTADPW